MSFDNVFQTSLFIQRLQKCVVVEKMGRMKKSTDASTGAFNEHVCVQSSREETVALGRDLYTALGKRR